MKPEQSGMGETEAILSSFFSLSHEGQVEVVSSLLYETARQQEKNPAELLDVVAIPFGIFAQKRLSSLEAIVKYLKEVKSLKLAAIAEILGRDSRTIWSTFSHASKKMPEPFSQVRDDVAMPASAIADRSLSVLEHVVVFAKKLGYSNHEVAVMLHLDDRTIWSVLNRAKKKGERI